MRNYILQQNSNAGETDTMIPIDYSLEESRDLRVAELLRRLDTIQLPKKGPLPLKCYEKIKDAIRNYIQNKDSDLSPLGIKNFFTFHLFHYLAVEFGFSFSAQETTKIIRKEGMDTYIDLHLKKKMAENEDNNLGLYAALNTFKEFLITPTEASQANIFYEIYPSYRLKIYMPGADILTPETIIRELSEKLIKMRNLKEKKEGEEKET